MSALTLTPNLPDPDAGLPVAFFAAATTASIAIPISLQRGQEPAADIRLLDRPRFTVRVRLTGFVPRSPRLVFVPYGGDLCAGADWGLSAKGPGSFEIRDVPEGLYVAMAMSGRDSISDVVTIRVEAKSDPREETRIPVVPPVDVRGNLFFDRLPPNTYPDPFRVNLVRAGQELSQISTSVVDPSTGRFMIPGVGPGSYYPALDLPPGVYVQNVLASKFDPTKPGDCDPDPSKAAPNYSYQDLHGHFDAQKPFQIPSVIPNAAECLVINVGFGTSLVGIVRDRFLKPVEGALVVALPKSVWGKELDKGATPPDRYLTGVTDDNGYFQLRGAADQAFSIAGQNGQVDTEYHLYAFEDVDPNVIYNPEFSSQVSGREIVEVREMQYMNGRWVVTKLTATPVVTSKSCGLDTPVYRGFCYLRSISAEDSANLQ